MKAYEISPNQAGDVTPERYAADEPYRVPAAKIEIGQELLLRKKLRIAGNASFITQDSIRVLELKDAEDRHMEVTITHVSPNEEISLIQEVLRVSPTSYVVERPSGPDKVQDWSDWPEDWHKVGYFLLPTQESENT